VTELYAMQKKVPGYARLLNETRVIGTWDDHDYGINDGDKGYPYRVESQKAFLDFMDEPENSPRREQNGVYDYHEIDFSNGKKDVNRRVAVHLLDVRFNKDPYTVGKTGDFLGEEQWRWLEEGLRKSTARVNLIVSGLQVLTDRRVPRHAVGEYWNRFPGARQRLLELIIDSNVSAPVLLSGDIHMAEILGARCKSVQKAGDESAGLAGAVFGSLAEGQEGQQAAQDPQAAKEAQEKSSEEMVEEIATVVRNTGIHIVHACYNHTATSILLLVLLLVLLRILYSYCYAYSTHTAAYTLLSVCGSRARGAVLRRCPYCGESGSVCGGGCRGG
jgi:hypothetical protein